MKNTNWKKFERVVAAIHRARASGGDVRWNDVINGRQFDVTIRFKFGLHDYLTVIECKHYSGRVSVETVDALVTKARDVHANKAILVSSNGYQSGCIPVAERHGISLLVLSEKVVDDISRFAVAFAPALDISEVGLILRSGERYKLEDEGGRLAYLMRHTKILGHAGAATPDDLISNWQRSRPAISLKGKNNVYIELNAGARVVVPYDGDFEATRIQFQCEIVEAPIENGPMIDARVRGALATEYQLSDASGEVLHTARMQDLELGEPDGVRSGQFYSQPDIGINYFCFKIMDGLVTWIVLENYQHGILFQATLEQKIEFAKHYLEITDKRLLVRLNSMLKDYLQRNSDHLSAKEG